MVKSISRLHLLDWVLPLLWGRAGARVPPALLDCYLKLSLKGLSAKKIYWLKRCPLPP